MRPLRAQLVAALTALVVLLPGSAFGRTQYFCRMMNRVVATCCCGVDSSHEDGPSCAAQIRATDCCARISTPASSATLKAVGTEISVPSAAIAAVVPRPVHVFSKVVEPLTPPRQARAPPIVGPPLFIAHCSLLT